MKRFRRVCDARLYYRKAERIVYWPSGSEYKLALKKVTDNFDDEYHAVVISGGASVLSSGTEAKRNVVLKDMDVWADQPEDVPLRLVILAVPVRSKGIGDAIERLFEAKKHVVEHLGKIAAKKGNAARFKNIHFRLMYIESGGVYEA